ncbi:MAG TPA: dipeptide epimerase, partial [Parasegetibacter sp.]
EIERRMQQLHDLCAGNYTAKSAFDMALYDIAAKAAGKPLYAYLGGQKKELKTDITIGIGTPEEMSSLASELVSQGANIIKIKLGKGYQQDIERVRQIREKVGDKIILRLDANQGWDFDEARTVLTEVAPYQIQFCEQPMRKHFDYLLPELRKHSSVKIMADESCFVDHDAKRLIRENACDYINIKLAKSGGIHEALKIHHSANEAGIPCMLGAMLESKLAATANLHLACACEGIEFIDQDSFLLGHLEDPVNGGAVYNGFRITMPDIPGIGAEPDPAFLARCGKIVI